MNDGELICKQEPRWWIKLAIKFSFTFIGFIIITFFYSKFKFELDTFMADYPGFPASFIPKYIIPLFYPIIFFLPALAVEEFLRNSSIQINNTTKKSIIFIGQITISFAFFYILLYIMFNTPGYPSPVDQNQINEAFTWFCISTFVTAGLLGSDDLKKAIENSINYLINRH
jgi:hypothetical protein